MPDSFLADSFVPDETTAEERAPGPSTPAQATLPSANIAPWLAQKLGELDPKTWPIGATIGGIGLPLVAGMATEGGSIPASMALSGLGAAGGQTAQDYLTTGAADWWNTAKQGAIGATGPLLGAGLRGLGVLKNVIGRGVGALPAIEDVLKGLPSAEQIVAGSSEAVPTTAIQDLVNQYTTTTAGGVLAGGKGEGAQKLLDFLSPRAASPVIPLTEYQQVMDQVGSAVGRNPYAPGAYKQMMDVIRQLAANGNKVAAQWVANAAQREALTAQQAVEQNLTTAITPNLTSGGLGTLLGGGAFYRSGGNPLATAAGLTLPYAARAGYGLAQAGGLNPYATASANLALQSLNQRYLGD